MLYRFAEFEIDVSQQELRRLGEPVHIEPQVFDLIVHLVRNHERAAIAAQCFVYAIPSCKDNCA